MPKAQAALDQKQDKADLIKQVHRDLLYFLINVVNSRINLKGTQDGVHLMSQELDKDFLRKYSNAMFPLGLNRTWKKQEDMNELKEFLSITKATFGAFRIRVCEDGLVRCFLISVIF
jgi:hypothetical protein